MVAGANPGQGPTIKVGFANDQGSWEEQADLVALLADVLAREGRGLRREGDRLEISPGLVLRPQFVSLDPQQLKGAKTCTTIEFTHPRFGDERLFEFQHSMGDDINQAFTSGFDAWVQFDLPAILDALRPDATDCNVMMMTYPANEVRAAPLKRRVVLGPPAHVAANRDETIDAEHPFCPCCLLTNSFEAFRPLLEADALCGVRLFAMRGEDGVGSADCRVNGEAFDAGIAALAKYVDTWPERGFEFRKQYVILQTI